jgi:hypothetical protein
VAVVQVVAHQLEEVLVLQPRDHRQLHAHEKPADLSDFSFFSVQ